MECLLDADNVPEKGRRKVPKVLQEELVNVNKKRKAGHSFSIGESLSSLGVLLKFVILIEHKQIDHKRRVDID